MIILILIFWLLLTTMVSHDRQLSALVPVLLHLVYNLRVWPAGAVDHPVVLRLVLLWPIEPADRGAACSHVEEAQVQLDHRIYYEQLKANPIDEMKKELSRTLSKARDHDWVSENEFAFLLIENPAMLPKIHQNLEDPNARHIISSNLSLSLWAVLLNLLWKIFPPFLKTLWMDVFCRLMDTRGSANCYMLTLGVASTH